MGKQRAVGRKPAPRFLETTVALEKKFLQGRQNRAEELESAVRYFLEFLMGSAFWSCMLAFFDKSLLAERTTDPEDLQLFHITDSPEEAVGIVLRSDQGAEECCKSVRTGVDQFE